ncbi:MAG: transcription termination/antitermination protein NusA [Kiritimatiellaeota bacterium]|nr:transcription termination/antitermination protein NusA [Kiritimatiellota bacterium]
MLSFARRKTTPRFLLFDTPRNLGSHPHGRIAPARTIPTPENTHTHTSLMNNELLATLSIIEREKGIAREILIQAVEGALQKAARKSLGTSRDARVEINPKTCDITVFQTLIVNDSEKGSGYIPLKAARILKPEIQIGDQIEVKAEAKDFGRIAAQTAKQALFQAIRAAEREVVFHKYLPMVGRIVNATVKEIVRGSCICAVDGGGEAILPLKQKLPTDKLNPTQQFRALLFDVLDPRGAMEAAAKEPAGSGSPAKDNNSPGIILSRTSPDFLRALFTEQVSEIKDGSIEIINVVRDPEERRAKISVRSLDGGKIDPVGACIGTRGARIQAVQRELNGEKIDVVTWSADPRVHAINALAPAKIEFVEMVPFVADPREDRRLGEPADAAARKYMIRAVVPRSGFTQAIGKRGQNVRLSSRLIGWKISIEQKEEKSLDDAVREANEALAAQLGIPVETAKIFFDFGYTTPEGITNSPSEMFVSDAGIKGIDPELAEQIWAKAEEFMRSKISNQEPLEYAETEDDEDTETEESTTPEEDEATPDETY